MANQRNLWKIFGKSMEKSENLWKCMEIWMEIYMRVAKPVAVSGNLSSCHFWRSFLPFNLAICLQKSSVHLNSRSSHKKKNASASCKQRFYHKQQAFSAKVRRPKVLRSKFAWSDSHHPQMFYRSHIPISRWNPQSSTNPWSSMVFPSCPASQLTVSSPARPRPRKVMEEKKAPAQGIGLLLSSGYKSNTHQDWLKAWFYHMFSIFLVISLMIRGLPEIGVPPNHQFFDGFSLINPQIIHL